MPGNYILWNDKPIKKGSNKKNYVAEYLFK
jgi:hypothetical protein